MYVVIEVPDGKPEEVCDMVKYVGLQMSLGETGGTFVEGRWSIVDEEEEAK